MFYFFISYFSCKPTRRAFKELPLQGQNSKRKEYVNAHFLNTKTWLRTRAAVLIAVEWLRVCLGGGKPGLGRAGAWADWLAGCLVG